MLSFIGTWHEFGGSVLNQPTHQGVAGPPRVSVIIPIYNGEATIERCLDSIVSQETTFPFEIVVVDSSTDRTPEIIASRYPTVRLIRLDERTFPGSARNIGIRQTNAPYITLIDADCIASPGLLERMIAIHESGHYAAVGGALCNGTPRSLSGIIGYLLEFREFIPSSPRREVFTIPTANICYRRKMFEKYGYFDDVRASEDLLYNWRLSIAEEPILFDPELRVTHLNKTGWSTVIAYQRVLGESSALARHRMNPPFEVMRAFPALGWLMPYLIRYPWLGVFVPPVRLFRALVWLARYDWKLLGILVLMAPLYLAGAYAWAAAFVRALRDARETGRPGVLSVDS